MEKCAGNEDIIFRIGGDEFVLLTDRELSLKALKAWISLCMQEVQAFKAFCGSLLMINKRFKQGVLKQARLTDLYGRP